MDHTSYRRRQVINALRGLFLYLVIALFMPQMLSAQSCLPEGITFTRQSQIDSFPILYPNCTEIIGNVFIGAWNGNDLIYNLDSLIAISQVGGRLDIVRCQNLRNLNGLESVSSVGDYLLILENDSLNNLDGLHSLASIGDGMAIEGNTKITDLNGLSSLTSVGAELRLVQNYNLGDISGLSSVSSIGEELLIVDCDALQNLNGLNNILSIGGALGIISIDDLNDITSLINLKTIGGNLSVSWNPNLNSLSGLDSIDSETIENLHVIYNPLLSICDVTSICNYLSDPNGSISIQNADGCSSPEEVEEACTVSISELQSASQLSVYPNPFTTSTTIEYELTEPSRVQLTIYNAIGETIYEAEDGIMPQGKHTFTWSPESLPEGMYYGVLRSEEGVSVVKMIKQ